MAHSRIFTSCGGTVALCIAGALVPATACADLYGDFLNAADAGECIENVTYRVLLQRGPAHAAPVVATALRVLSEREVQQRTLGCEGNIATQAIAAGADPDDVLEATAAGL